jgi:hypothetical protein
MTDDTSPNTSAFDTASWLAKDQEYARLCASIHPQNKAALFDALSPYSITHVVVTFDGCGDSGQIEDISAKAGDKDAALPSTNIEIARASWGSPDIVRSNHSVSDAIQELAYELLRQIHAGWENNEGAYGEFTFDVAERTITLDYNQRIETSEYTQHVF